MRAQLARAGGHPEGSTARPQPGVSTAWAVSLTGWVPLPALWDQMEPQSGPSALSCPPWLAVILALAPGPRHGGAHVEHPLHSRP